MRFELLCDPEDAQSECEELGVAFVDLADVWKHSPEEDTYDTLLACK